MKERDIPILKKEIRNLIFMQFYFGGLSIIANYPKTHSLEFIGVVSFTILIITIWGCLVSANLKVNKAPIFIFKSVTFMAVSGYFLAICFTSYYIYLNLKGILFPLIKILLYTLVISITYKIYSSILIDKRNQNKQKMFIKTVVLFSSAGYFLGWFLNRQINQIDMHILLIVFSFLISCTCIMVSTVNVLKYKIKSHNVNYQ